jgi:DNA-binding IclR family transcriptional regulator
MRLRDWPNLRTACLAILTELEREFFSRRTFTELRRSTGLSQAEVEWALAELKSRQLVSKGGKNGVYERIYVPDAKPFV